MVENLSQQVNGLQHQGAVSKGSNQPDMKSFMRMMDVASELRKQREVAGEQFQLEETRENLKKRLRATAEVTGEKLTDAEIEAAIESFFSGLYRFKPAEPGFQNWLARVYVARKKIFKLVAIPLMLIGFLTTGFWSVNKSWQASEAGKVEEKVEQKVDGLASRHIAAAKRLQILSGKSADSLDSAPGLKTNLLKAEGTNKALTAYFKKYTKNGRAKPAVNSTNLRQAEAESIEISRQLVLLERQLDQSERQFAQVGKLKTLPREIHGLYQAVSVLSKDALVLKEAGSLNEQAKVLTKTQDAAGLEKISQRLGQMQQALSAEYKVYIVSRPGVKSGIDRFFTDASGKRASGYYLVVEARDEAGKVVPRTIVNSETGESARVKIWAEAAPKDVYQSVRQDKLDNGIVDRSLFSLKKRGELNEQLIFPGIKDADRRQITTW